MLMQVTSTVGRWILEKHGIYNPFSGVTTNQSESFNVVLKRLNSWTEVPLDVIVLSLYYLQMFYHNEIQRGFAGLGTYSLVQELVSTRRSVDEIVVIPTLSPVDIVDKIREREAPVVTKPDEDVDKKELDVKSATQCCRARYRHCIFKQPSLIFFPCMHAGVY